MTTATAVFAAPAPTAAIPDALGITPADLDKMALDPQSWQLQRDMSWGDFKPNPAIDWYKDLNPASLNSSKFAWDNNPNRPIVGGLLMFQYLDRKFISSQPVGSDPLGYYAMNQKYADPDAKGFTFNPVIDVYQLFADEEGISREALVTKYTTGENGPDAKGLTALDKKFAQWWADFLNKPSAINNFTGICEYWRENSYGKWDVVLRPSGPYTIPYFEFETMGGYDMSSGYQTYRDIPPSFRRGATGAANADNNFAFDTIAHAIARANGDFDGLDFFFLLHAGYDESGVWQEFGQAQFPSRKDIPYELGPGPRMMQVEEFFTENPEYLEIYAQRYANHYRPQFWADELKKYKESEPGAYVFKLSQEDWDWVNGYNDQTQKNTRYVNYTAWVAAIGEWSHAVSTVDVQYEDPVTGQTKTRTIRRSTQGENDAMATFAHEFCHISVVADNYGNAWTGAANPFTEPWDIVSRGSFAGPFGDHARWMVPGVEAGTVPTHLMQYLKNIHQEYNDAGEVLEVKVEDLANGVPVVADIVPRNIPLANDFYPGLAAYGLIPGDYYKSLKLDFAYNLTGDWADKNPTATRGFVNTSGKRATNIYVEVVDQSGYDSFTHDYGVLLSRAYDNPRRTYTGGTSPSHQVIDSHLYDIAMIDYTLGDKIEDYATYPIAHATQLADATFKAGVSYTDTGYYANKYKREPDGKPVIKPRPSNADLSAANWPLSPVSWDIEKTGSIVRWEDRDGRAIVSGDTVNEYYDALNKLHIYILQKNMIDGRKVNGVTQQILSYQVGVLHDDGKAVEGALELKPTTFAPATAGNYAKQTFELKNLGSTETDIVRITLDGSLAEGRTQEIQVITGETQPVTRIVPKPFSEQNAVILNDVYAVAPGETVVFDVFIKAADADLGWFPKELTVIASSETNADNEAEYKGADAIYGISLSPDTDMDFGEATAGYASQTAQSVTISNIGNRATDTLNITVSSTDFMLSDSLVASIGIGGTGSFTVVPITGLGAGIYTAAVTLSNTNIGAKSINVSFTVKEGATGGTGGGGGGGSNASITPVKADFDLAGGKDIPVTLNRNGLTLKSLKNGSYTLKEGTDYTVSGNIYTIKASYLETLSTGSQIIVFEMSGGTNPKLTITVKDSEEEETETGPTYKPMEPIHKAGEKVEATKTNNPLFLNDKETAFPAVKIGGWNWLKLRDFAILLNSTDKQFSVSYDAATNIIDIRTGQAYQPLGDELKDTLADVETAIASPQRLRVDGEFIDVAAYNIKGYNYFRLRDLAIILDFAVIYDEELAKITLDLDNPYTEVE
jgi:hypothetical protein